MNAPPKPHNCGGPAIFHTDYDAGSGTIEHKPREGMRGDLGKDILDAEATHGLNILSGMPDRNNGALKVMK